MTFKHLFLKDYDESSDDSFAVYTQSDVYDHIFYAVEQVGPAQCMKVLILILKVLFSIITEHFILVH